MPLFLIIEFIGGVRIVFSYLQQEETVAGHSLEGLIFA